MKPTLRGLLITVALISMYLLAFVAVSRHYPRAIFPWLVNGNNHASYIVDEDGRYIVCRVGSFGELTDFRVIGPPRPTLLRIWSPAIFSLALTGLAIALALRRPDRGRSEGLRPIYATPILLAGIWLVSPVFQMACDAQHDYHVHECKAVLGGKSVHLSPFWPRYRRLLMGRPWPGDYVCPVPPEESIAVPPSSKAPR
jgi:hypothetical protein